MKSTQRIGLLLTLVFLLPALFFSVYELSSLNKDEAMIQEIYSKQLEAILFSVNQYTDDVVGNWISRVEAAIGSAPSIDSAAAKLNTLLGLHSALRGIFVVDSAGRTATYNTFGPAEGPNPPFQFLSAVLDRHATPVNNLISYKRNGFQKVERLKLQTNESDGLHCLVFVMGQPSGQMRVGGFFIDARLFIEDVVGPRLQVIARDRFVLSVLPQGVDSTIYTTLAPGVEAGTDEALTKALWLLPDYVIGISPQGETIQHLVKERTRTNFILLVGLDAILIVAVVVVFINLKREVDLAQNKTDFVSNVSHELRTPLALISMFAETLEMNRAPTESKKREYYQIISKEAQRLTGIVNKILTFSQAEAKKKALHKERLDVDAALGEILRTYDFHLRNKGFDYALEGQEGLTLLADREAFIESLLNIIDNAVKYSDDTRKIILTRGNENGYTWVAVKDFGMGINRHAQKHIFDKFYRVPGESMTRSRGTGLGLSLVKQLMEEQGGKIAVESEPGKGTTFRLYFPND